MSAFSASHASNASLLARWDPRLRLLALVLLAFAYSSIKSLRAVPLMLITTGCFWVLCGLPIRYLLRRLRYPSALVLVLVAVLLFGRGTTPLYTLGFLRIRHEGLHAAMLVAARFYAILTLAIACFSVSPLLAHIAAMRALGVPFIMADMALLMVRYLEVLKQDLHNMHVSMRLRGFQNKGWSLATIKTTSWLAASLLLRSYERADGVYKAMRLRGYGQPHAYQAKTPLRGSDWAAFAAVVLLAAGLFWLG